MAASNRFRPLLGWWVFGLSAGLGMAGEMTQGVYRPSPGVLESLRNLPALAKPHLAYPSPRPFVFANADVLREYYRITGVVDLSVHYGPSDIVLQRARQAHELAPGLPAALHLSGWHLYGAKPDPKLKHSRCAEPWVDHPEYEQELEHLRTTLEWAKANFPQRIRWVALDYECWKMIRETDTPFIRAAVLRRLLDYHFTILSVLPDVEVIWEQLGQTRLTLGRGWVEYSETHPREALAVLAPISSISATAWTVYEPLEWRETMYRLGQTAETYGVGRIYLIIGLGWGNCPVKGHWELHGNQFNNECADGQTGFKYDPIFSWRIGSEANDPWFQADPRWKQYPICRTASGQRVPWERLTGVLFEPHPLWGKTAEDMDWCLAHFVEYVKGAHRIEPWRP